MIGQLIPFQIGAALCCFAPIVLPVIIFLIYLFFFTKPSGKGPKSQPTTYDQVGTPSEDTEDEEETIQVDEKEHPSKTYSEGESSYDQSFDRNEKKVDHQSDTMKNKKRSRSFLDKLLNRKEVCEECGAELEYRDAYESYYCPNCRTFK